MRYAVVIEKTATGFSAFVPYLPGCLVTGETRTEVKTEMKAAIRFHIDWMREDGLIISQPQIIAGQKLW